MDPTQKRRHDFAATRRVGLLPDLGAVVHRRRRIGREARGPRASLRFGSVPSRHLTALDCPHVRPVALVLLAA